MRKFTLSLGLLSIFKCLLAQPHKLGRIFCSTWINKFRSFLSGRFIYLFIADCVPPPPLQTIWRNLFAGRAHIRIKHHVSVCGAARRATRIEASACEKYEAFSAFHERTCCAPSRGPIAKSKNPLMIFFIFTAELGKRRCAKTSLLIKWLFWIFNVDIFRYIVNTIKETDLNKYLPVKFKAKFEKKIKNSTKNCRSCT